MAFFIGEGVLDMKYKKLGKITTKTKVKGSNNQDPGFIFYSYDKGSAALEFLFKNQDGRITDLTNTTFKILFTTDKDGQEKKFTIIDSQPIIDNPKSGVVIYPLSDQLLNYEGEVKGYVYLDFEDGTHSDELSFRFKVIRSKIDSEMDEVEDIYIKNFEEVKKEILEESKAYTDKLESDLPEKYYTKQETDEKLESKVEASSLAQVATSGNYNDLQEKPVLGIALDWRKLNVIATEAFYIVADDQGKAKKVLFWNRERNPFKENPTSCNLYQQTYNLTENKWRLKILRWANYESYQINGRGNVYVFTVDADINATDIDYCEVSCDWIDETYSSDFSGIPKIIQSL